MKTYRYPMLFVVLSLFLMPIVSNANDRMNRAELLKFIDQISSREFVKQSTSKCTFLVPQGATERDFTDAHGTQMPAASISLYYSNRVKKETKNPERAVLIHLSNGTLGKAGLELDKKIYEKNKAKDLKKGEMFFFKKNGLAFLKEQRRDELFNGDVGEFDWFVSKNDYATFSCEGSLILSDDYRDFRGDKDIDLALDKLAEKIFTNVIIRREMK